MLTRKMKEALDFIEYLESEEGLMPPTLEEIRVALGLCSRGAAYRVLFELQRRGFIGRVPYEARGIKLLRVPGRDAVLKFNADTKQLEPLTSLKKEKGNHLHG